MKVKPIINEISIYEIARYNKNTIGNHIKITNGEISKEKKEYANIVLFSLMNITGFIINKEGKSDIENIEDAISFADNLNYDLKEL